MVRPSPCSAADVDGAGERAQARGHHVEADAAAGDLGDHVARGESGQQREARDFGVGGHGVGGQQPALHGAAADVAQIEAAAVVGHLHGDDLATARHGQRDGAGARLAARDAFLGRLEAVVDGVAQDVQQRVDELVQHVGVDQDVAADDHERRLLAGGRRGLAHVALQARHDGLDRRHARLRSEMLPARA